MLAAWMILTQAPDVARIDQLAQTRDVGSLAALLVPGSPNPFRVLKTNGAYQVGSKGWHAVEARSPSGGERFVVLTTPLTTEDIGELVFRRIGERLQYVPESDDLGVRIARHSLEVRFDIHRKVALLTDRMELSKTAPGGAFLFRLSPNYRVSAINDSAGKPVPFSQAGGTVILDRPDRDRSAYTVAYAGVVDQPQYAGGIGPVEASLTNDYWYPTIARKPAAYAIVVHPPTGWTVVGQGIRQPSTDPATVRYRMDLPVTYYSLSVGRYRQATRTVDGRTFRAWSPRLATGQLQAQADMMAPIVEFYDRHFGSWPFAGYGALDSPNYGGGALEAYSYATYGGGLPEEDAHEPSHTLFGGVLGNDYLRSFWNESFAAFCEGFYGREAPIGDSAERRLAFIRVAQPESDYEDGACATTGAEDGPLASSLGYGKGALVLQMLEQTIGTARFESAVHLWRAMRHPGDLTGWEDFETAVAEAAPGAPIHRFFDGWIRQPKVPKLRLVGVSRTPDGVRVALRVTPSGFVFPLDLLLIGGDGTRLWHRAMVDATSEDVSIDVATPTKVTHLSVDPWRRVLRHMDSDEEVPSLANRLPSMMRIVDPAHVGYLKPLPPGDSTAGTLMVGHPDTMPALRERCRKVGFLVKGDTLTYRGTTIDLRSGGALALIDRADGKQDAIGLGNVEVAPNLGNARLALFDRYGRFLRGETTPKTRGGLTAAVP